MSYALQCGILLRRENLMYSYWAPVDAVTGGGYKMVLFTASRGKNFVGRIRTPPSALLAFYLNFLHDPMS